VDKFYSLFNILFLNALAAVGLVFLSFSFSKLFYQQDREQARFFMFLSLGWVINLVYLMFIDMSPKTVPVAEDALHFFVRLSNTVTFLFFLLAARWQMASTYRRRLSLVAPLACGIGIALYLGKVGLPSMARSLAVPSILIGPTAIGLVGLSYHRYFTTTRQSFRPLIPHLLVYSLYAYALLQFALFLLPPYTSYFISRIPNFEKHLFLIGASIKLVHILGLSLYGAAAFAQYQSSFAFLDRARISIALADQLGHEIKSPARALHLRLKSLSSDVTQIQPTNADLGAIRNQTEQVLSLIEVFESFRADQRLDLDAPATRKVVNLNNACDEVIINLKLTARPMCKFEKLYSSGPVLLIVPSELSQILRNLIKNAVEAVERNLARPGEVRTVTVRTNTYLDSAKVTLAVLDNGAGIADSIAAHMFEDGVTTNKEPGRGHGLAIVKRLVEKHGGNITASNLLDGAEICGAQYVVELPLARRA